MKTNTVCYIKTTSSSEEESSEDEDEKEEKKTKKVEVYLFWSHVL